MAAGKAKPGRKKKMGAAAPKSSSRTYGSVKTAAGGYRARGGALALVGAERPKSAFNPAGSVSRNAARRALGAQSSPLPSDGSISAPGGNTGTKKVNDNDSTASSAKNTSVTRRARPGEFSQRKRGATARRLLRNLARTGTPGTQERARAYAAKVGVKV